MLKVIFIFISLLASSFCLSYLFLTILLGGIVLINLFTTSNYSLLNIAFKAISLDSRFKIRSEGCVYAEHHISLIRWAFWPYHPEYSRLIWVLNFVLISSCLFCRINSLKDLPNVFIFVFSRLFLSLMMIFHESA